MMGRIFCWVTLELSLVCLTMTQMGLMAFFFGETEATTFCACMERGSIPKSLSKWPETKISSCWASICSEKSLINFVSKLRLLSTKQANYTDPYSTSSLLSQLPYKKGYWQKLRVLQRRSSLTGHPVASLPKHTGLQDEQGTEDPRVCWPFCPWLLAAPSDVAGVHSEKCALNKCRYISTCRKYIIFIIEWVLFTLLPSSLLYICQA